MKKSSTTLIRLMQERGETLALAESVTCGLAAHQLGNVKGINEVFAGSIVCYHPDVKTKLLRVPRNVIAAHTAESQLVTDTLAMNLGKVIPADVHVAITGLAAPGGSETKVKPVGTIYVSVRYRNKLFRKRHVHRGAPSMIKKKACDSLFMFIADILQKH